MIDIAKQEFKQLSWIVTNYDCNANKIRDYDVLKYKEDDIKKLKKKCNTIDEFAENLKRKLKWQYWSRSEYELILTLTDDNRIILTPWCGCRNLEEVAIDVTDRTDFNWRGFTEKYISIKGHNNTIKIDIWDQIEFEFDEFVDYCWNYRFKYGCKRKGE